MIFAGESDQLRTMDENTSTHNAGFQPAVSDEVPDRPGRDTAQHNAGRSDVEQKLFG